MSKNIYLNLGILLSVIIIASLSLSDTLKTGSVKSLSATNFINSPLIFSGNKSLTTKDLVINNIALESSNAFSFSYNLNGVCLLSGTAAKVSLHQKNIIKEINLADYVENCSKTNNFSIIPFNKIIGFDSRLPLEKISFSFWYPTYYKIEISSFSLTNLEENVLGAFSSTNPLLEKNLPVFKPLRPNPYLDKFNK